MTYGERRCVPRWISVVGSLILTSCSVTGLDSASDRFHCDAPKGVPCSSTSGVYANSLAGTVPRLPARLQGSDATGVSTGAEAAAPLPPVGLAAPRRVVPGAGQAIRSLPRQLRVLVFPWVDADNDLHDQSYLYMAVDPGRWLIEHTRAGIRNDAPVPRLAQEQPRAEGASGRDEGEPPQARAEGLQRSPAMAGSQRAPVPPGLARPGLTESPVYARDVERRDASRPSQDDED